MLNMDDLFKRFIARLRSDLKRDISKYRFEEWQSDSLREKFLIPFLEARMIPISYVCSVENGETLPFRFVRYRPAAGKRPLGTVVVFPDTPMEIVIASHLFMGDRSDASQTIVAYRDAAAYANFVEEFQTYQRLSQREDGRIIVFDEEDIPIPDLTWDDIVLPPELLDDIRPNIEGFARGRETYRWLGVPYKRGFLFAGPPGNGKTMLLRVFASMYRDFKFILFPCKSDTNNFEINLVFDRASELSPSILCIEDIDSLFRSKSTLSYLLNKMDGFEPLDGILILATTNHPEEIDPALLSRPSRFDRVWVFKNPDNKTRKVLLDRYFGSLVSETFLGDLVHQTEGFSMAYLKELRVLASLYAIDAGQDAPGEKEIAEALLVLTSQLRGARKQFVSAGAEVGFGVGSGGL